MLLWYTQRTGEQRAVDCGLHCIVGLDFGSRVGIQGSGFKVECWEFGVWDGGLGCQVYGAGGKGFKVERLKRYGCKCRAYGIWGGDFEGVTRRVCRVQN